MKVPARPEPCNRPDWVPATEEDPEPPAPVPVVMEEKPVAVVPLSLSLSFPVVRSGMTKCGWGRGGLIGIGHGARWGFEKWPS